MEVQGNAGRGARHYGNEHPPDVLKGRLMDEDEERPPKVEQPECRDAELPETPEDGAYDAIEYPLTRWGYEMADERYNHERR